MTTRRLRVVFFGTGGLLSAGCLKTAALGHDVLGVVRAERHGRARHLAGRVARRIGAAAPDPLAEAARGLGIHEWRVRSLGEPRLAQRLAAQRVDVICVANFPWRLPETLLDTAAEGGINLHASLLPRHRGPLPLFWVYHADDRVAGVTIHHMTPRFDEGDIIGQQSFPLPRGYPVDDLNARNAQAGAELVDTVLGAISRGEATRRAQDSQESTGAPIVARGRSMVDFDAWDVERVWHFLAGLWPRFIEPLTDVDSGPVTYGGVAGFERGAPEGPVGRVRRIDDGELVLYCRDGLIRLRDVRSTTGVSPDRGRR